MKKLILYVFFIFLFTSYIFPVSNNPMQKVKDKNGIEKTPGNKLFNTVLGFKYSIGATKYTLGDGFNSTAKSEFDLGMNGGAFIYFKLAKPLSLGLGIDISRINGLWKDNINEVSMSLFQFGVWLAPVIHIGFINIFAGIELRFTYSANQEWVNNYTELDIIQGMKQPSISFVSGIHFKFNVKRNFYILAGFEFKHSLTDLSGEMQGVKAEEFFFVIGIARKFKL